ncbi:MAG: biopolymer transporter ExbD [Chitinophagales bacterium]|nr:MAG: biopolymer transporter ExbD [Chitinophagales bacterium]
MNLRSRNKVEAQFNLSSLTDIIFLLLIFFMLTSTLVSINAIKLILPTSESKITDKRSVSVSITKDLEYYVDQQRVRFNELKGALKKKIEGVENPTVVLHVEKSVPIENVVQVMNIGYEMKLNMILATQPPEKR